MLQLGRNPQVSGVHILPAKEGPVALLQRVQPALSMSTTSALGGQTLLPTLSDTITSIAMDH